MSWKVMIHFWIAMQYKKLENSTPHSAWKMSLKEVLSLFLLTSEVHIP